jgi:hypothetical protein
MDVEDFTREVKPHHKRSRLEKFKVEIRDLKARGYSDMQIRDWLAENGISVSRENVRKFIKRHLTGQDTAPHQVQPGDTPATPAPDQSAQLGMEKNATAETRRAEESTAARMQRLAREQRNEATNALFKHDKTGNNH